MPFPGMIQSIKSRFSKMHPFKIRNNLFSIVFLYFSLLMLFLLLYSSLALSLTVASNARAEVFSVASQVRLLASHPWLSEDSPLKSSPLASRGSFFVADSDGIVRFTTNSTVSARFTTPEVWNKLHEAFGAFKVPVPLHGYDYVFYEKSANARQVLLYVLPASFLAGPTLSAIGFICVLTVLCLAGYILALRRFRSKIYNPIIHIEKVIHGIVEGGITIDTFNIEKASPLFTVYSDLNIMIEKLRDLLLREYNANMMKKQAELVALQSQINPHFLYNTLESIRGQAISHGMEDIEIMTKALSDLFRYSITKKGNLVTLEEELQNVSNYLLIQQYRFSNKFLIVNKVDADTLSYRIPKLLIQPIVENAIHHGLETKIGQGTVTIIAFRPENRLVVNIQDDGMGIEHERLVEMNDILVKVKAQQEDTGSGLKIGLINANERIKLNFGNEYGLRLYSSKDIGTRVEIVLPLVSD
jgi:sensor histidine kinase YesM